MKFMKILPILLLVIAFAISMIACSKGKSPVEPVINDVPISFGTESENRSVLAVYNAVIDPDAKTFTVEPANRSAEYHFPLTQMYPNVLQITDYGWTPNFWADIKISHPLPGSGIDGFDPRVIAILPANPGVSMNYPIFNVHANNSVVMEPDGYTKLFDWINPSITGNANPFIAYFKEQAYRQWSSINPVEETRRWDMDLNGFGGSFAFKLVVDVSTNYPQPPYPYIDNAPEPVQMQIEIGDGLTPIGGSATVTATLLDWQGYSEIKCKVESPDLFDGSVQLFYSEPGPNPHEYVFTGTISNDLGAEPGNHDVLLAAWDINVGNHVFIESVACVDVIFNLVDITPPWLQYAAMDYFINGNYLYVAGYQDGLFIYDISDPVNPGQVINISFPLAMGVFVSGNYAYVTDRYNGLQIIDINPPESAHVVNLVDIQGCVSIYVSGNYAYVGAHPGVYILDITQPSSAYVINTIGISGDAPHDIFVSNGYMYVANTKDSDNRLLIYDIDPPESAEYLKTVHTQGDNDNNRLCVSEGYAYVINGCDMQIVDIDPVENAYVANTIDSPNMLTDIAISGDYAFITSAGNSYDLYIIDISQPESAFVINASYLWNEAPAMLVCISNGYAYISSGRYGLKVMNVDPPETAFVVNTIEQPGTINNVFVCNDYAYAINSEYGLLIIDVSQPESAYLVNSVDLPLASFYPRRAFVTDGYAYIGNGSAGMQIIDVDPPESAYIVNSIDTPDNAYNVFVSGCFAYMGVRDTGLQIVNIDPPESAHLINTVDASSRPYNVFVSGSYAYVTDYYDDLLIIDIDPPESAFLVNVVDTPDPSRNNDVYVCGGYAYVADYYKDFMIIDIDPPESAHCIKTIESSKDGMGVYVSGCYAYLATCYGGLQVIDIDPPESASVVDSITMRTINLDVHVSDGYAYVADDFGGLRIIDLW